MKNQVERLLKFLTIKGITEQKKISEIFECSQAYVSKIVKKDKINFKYVQSVFEEYPDLNKEWVLTGAGEMILDGKQSKKSKSPNIDDFFQKQLEEKDKVINNLLQELEFVRAMSRKMLDLDLGKAKGTNTVRGYEVEDFTITPIVENPLMEVLENAA